MLYFELIVLLKIIGKKCYMYFNLVFILIDSSFMSLLCWNKMVIYWLI